MAGHGADDALAGLAEAKRVEYVQEKSISLHDDKIASSIEDEIDIHDGLEYPTEEERHTLRRVSDTIPWNAYCKFDFADIVCTKR